MWRSRTGRDRKTVVCIACGSSVLRSEAREYDKEGDRWNRHGKQFEYLCKDCHRELCWQPRDELESLILDIEQDGLPQSEFLTRYLHAVEDRYGRPEE
ncbi:MULTISPECIES: DUF7562 family protein [Haloprofundus]|uniref:DUF7562 family protein n=1 Tax=Haloprofundus TaxID=1911573 RepID=UPI000E448E89|nr:MULTISPECIES: hypothetical protein [Haloprofundus]QCJ47208.1 hypothetical protein FCF25_08790 [Haloprofundus sp. MHR1]